MLLGGKRTGLFYFERNRTKFNLFTSAPLRETRFSGFCVFVRPVACLSFFGLQKRNETAAVKRSDARNNRRFGTARENRRNGRACRFFSAESDGNRFLGRRGRQISRRYELLRLSTRSTENLQNRRHDKPEYRKYYRS